MRDWAMEQSELQRGSDHWGLCPTQPGDLGQPLPSRCPHVAATRPLCLCLPSSLELKAQVFSQGM